MPTTPRTTAARAKNTARGAPTRQRRTATPAGVARADAGRADVDLANFTDIAGYVADIAGYVALPRVTALAVSPDGSRLVAAVQQPDTEGAKYVSALWELDPAGTAEPRRLTFSSRGEAAPRFAADGTLLFTSGRPDAEGDQADAVAKTASGDCRSTGKPGSLPTPPVA